MYSDVRCERRPQKSRVGEKIPPVEAKLRPAPRSILTSCSRRPRPHQPQQQSSADAPDHPPEYLHSSLPHRHARCHLLPLLRERLHLHLRHARRTVGRVRSSPRRRGASSGAELPPQQRTLCLELTRLYIYLRRAALQLLHAARLSPRREPGARRKQARISPSAALALAVANAGIGTSTAAGGAGVNTRDEGAELGEEVLRGLLRRPAERAAVCHLQQGPQAQAGELAAIFSNQRIWSRHIARPLTTLYHLTNSGRHRTASGLSCDRTRL